MGEGYRGALPGSVTAAPLAKVTDAKVAWLLNRSIYRIITVIITLLSVISTDFNLSKQSSTQSLCLTLLGKLWQRVMQDLLSVLSMNSSSCPGGSCVYDSSLKAPVFIYCPISPSALWWAQGRCQGFAHPGSRAAAHRCSLSVSRLPKRRGGIRSLPLCLHTDASVVLL